MNRNLNYFEADIEVFWDVTEFPICSTNRSYLETLRSGLDKCGYTGKMKITAYGEEKPDNLGDGITFELIRGKYSRLTRMLLDIAVWETDTALLSFTAKNVLVMAENIEEETIFVYVSFNLQSNANNCLWVLPDDYEDEKINRIELPCATFMWKWQDLLAGKGPMSPQVERALRAKAPRNNLVQ